MSNQNTINKNFSYATATGNTNKMCIVKESSVQSPAPAVATHFPTQLHFVLSELEADGMAHIASWQPHGRCFLVHKPKEFLESVLTKWFRQTKIASFQRQLNIYGFKRIASGPDKNAYYHEYFLLGKINLSRRILQKKPKDKTEKASRPIKSDPNFYAMDALLEVPHSTDSAGDAVKDCTTNEKGVSALDSKLMPTPSIGILGSAANQVGQLHSHALLPCSSRQYCNQKPRRAIQLAPSMDASRWAGLRSDAATMQGQLSLQRALVRDMVMQSVAARRSEVERRLECGYPYQHYSTTTTTTTGTNSRIAPSAVTSTSILRRMLADALSE